jgi:hypothetical protein
MPLIPWDDESAYSVSSPGARLPAIGDTPEVVRPSAWETGVAALRHDNPVASTLSNVDATTEELLRKQDGFDLYKRLKDDGLEDDEPFLDVFNDKAYEARRAQVQMEAQDRKTLDAAGLWGDLASVGAQLASPDILLPGGAIYRGAKGGYALGRSALSVGTAAVAGAAASETVLQGTQVTRPASETVFALGGSAILGAALGGGAAAYLGRAQRRALSKQIDQLTRSTDPDDLEANETAVRAMLGGAQSAGAAASRAATLEDNTVAGRAAGAVLTASSWARLNPSVRLNASPLAKVREVANNMMENPLYLKKNFEGQASDPAIETLVKETNGKVAQAIVAQNDAYKAHRAAGGVLTKSEFLRAAGRAARRSDESPDPNVAKAAQAWRSAVIEPLKDAAVAAGRLPADVHVTTADSYFSRLYNWRKIEANEFQFKGIVRNWISRQVDDAAEKFVSAEDRSAYIDEVVESIFNKITGRGDTMPPIDLVPTTRGPLKERTFNIPDRMIEEFLEDDIELVGRRYARVMSAEIELSNKFGSPDMKDVLRDVRTGYADLRKTVNSDAKLTADAKQKKLEKLNAAEKRDITDIEAMRDMLRGAYKARENSGTLNRVLAVAGTLNYLRSMGGVVASSVTDVARPMMVHGLGRYMSAGVVPLVTNLKALRLTAKEARAAGIAERILNSRMATLAEITDPYSMSSPFERWLENVSIGFSRLTLMPLWNDFQKLFTSAMTQDRILEGVTSYARLRAEEKTYLAFLGIDENMAARIAGQWDGTKDGTVRIANTEAWDDPVAVRAFRAAINKDVDSTIVTKGMGDVMLWQHTPIGRTVLQFKSFALASHQRAFMRGLQAAELGVDGGRAAQLAGLLSATSIGAFIYFMKSVEANRTEDISDNPGRFIAEGLDRSGLFSVMFEINNTVEKAFGLGAYASLQALFPSDEQAGKASRYMQRSVAASFTGPTGDFIDTIARVGTGLQRRDKQGNYTGLNEGDVNAIRRLAPFATLPIARSVVEYGIMPGAREAVAD